jgi:hypothetical protein
MATDGLLVGVIIFGGIKRMVDGLGQLFLGN